MTRSHRTSATVLLLALSAMSCNQSKTTTSSTGSPAAPGSTSPTAESSPTAAAPSADEKSLPGGLKYVDMKVGDGAIAESGKTVSVHYTGWLTDGTKFDSSVDRGQPFSFPLGA